MTPWNTPREGRRVQLAKRPVGNERVGVTSFPSITAHSLNPLCKATSSRSNASSASDADGLMICRSHRPSRGSHDITSWLQNVPEVSNAVDLGGYNCAGVSGEIAPRNWLPETLIDEETPFTWWKISQADGTMDGPQPWWLTYISSTSDILRPLPHPMTFANDDESGTSAVTRRASTTSSVREARRLWRQDAEAILLGKEETHRTSSKLDVTVRHTKMSDIPDITAIYSEYIKHSYICPENVPFTDLQVRQHWLSIEDAKLPYLVADIPIEVACEADQENKQRQVIGFCHAGNYKEADDMFFYTVEITVFVRKGYCRQSVGRYLMDRLLTLLDPAHLPCYGYNVKERGSRYASNEKREVRAIMYRVPYDANDDSSLRWQAAWLDRLGFKNAGNLDRIGSKLGCSVSIAIFVKRTGKSYM